MAKLVTKNTASVLKNKPLNKSNIKKAREALDKNTLSKEDVLYILTQLEAQKLITSPASDLTQEYLQSSIDSIASLTKEVINYDSEINKKQLQINKDMCSFESNLNTIQQKLIDKTALEISNLNKKIEAIDPELIKKQIDEESRLRAISQVDLIPIKSQLIELDAKIESIKEYIKDNSFWSTFYKLGLYTKSCAATIFTTLVPIITYWFVYGFALDFSNQGQSLLAIMLGIFSIPVLLFPIGYWLSNNRKISDLMRKLDSYNNYYNILFKLQQDIKNVIKYGLSECKTKDEAKKLYESKLGVFSSVTDSLNLPAIELEKFFTQSKKRVSEDLCNLEKEYVQAQELQKLDLIIAESDREDDFKELERQEKSKTL